MPKANVLMVCRLDGPAPETVKRLIDDALAAEKHGLTGIAYFDARWPKPIKTPVLDAYHIYDRAIHNAARCIARLRTTGIKEFDSFFCFNYLIDETSLFFTLDMRVTAARRRSMHAMLRT